MPLLAWMGSWLAAIRQERKSGRLAARLAMRRVSMAAAQPMVLKFGINRKPKVLTLSGRACPAGKGVGFVTAICMSSTASTVAFGYQGCGRRRDADQFLFFCGAPRGAAQWPSLHPLSRCRPGFEQGVATGLDGHREGQQGTVPWPVYAPWGNTASPEVSLGIYTSQT